MKWITFVLGGSGRTGWRDRLHGPRIWTGRSRGRPDLRHRHPPRIPRLAGDLRWRTATERIPPSARMISSPHDLEARYAKQDTTSWMGDKVHFTESYEADTLHLMTHQAVGRLPAD